jgi:transcriptional regulator with XRE-family HTH domain
MSDIYLKIKDIRLKKNLTQEEISKKLGMAQSNYARMERGLSQITVERLGEIAEIFEMSPEAIFSYSEAEGNFKEDVQFYINQVKKLETKKLEKDIEHLKESDFDGYSSREKERQKLASKMDQLKKEIAVKDATILDRQRTIEKLEKEIEEKNKSIAHLQNSNTKLLELLSK